MQQVKPAEATDTLSSWISWLKNHQRGNGKVATIGWCFGGGWSLNASLASPVDATVIYYGNVAKKAAQLDALKGPVQSFRDPRRLYQQAYGRRVCPGNEGIR